MILIVQQGERELETDTPAAAAKAVKERLQGIGGGVVRIIVERAAQPDKKPEVPKVGRKR